MYHRQKYILSLILIALSTIISSCDSHNTADKTNIETTPNSQVSPTPLVRPYTNDDNTKAMSGKTTNITLYTSDAQCQKLIPKQAEVSAQTPINGAIGQIFKEQNTADFSVSGYRVNVKNGIATVDLRISPNSKRQIASLSSCEQFALFSSVRKTLISNSQWKIKDVRFTERGEDITL
ncbi:MAG: sporulation/spore germination protein, partial [Cuspidothrix sp.]